MTGAVRVRHNRRWTATATFGWFKLIGLEAENVSLRLMADGAADVASGLAAAANGLALIDDPARARAVARVPNWLSQTICLR